MSDFLDSMSDADLRNEFRALLNRVAALEQRPVQVDAVDQIAVDLGEFSAFLFKMMDGQYLRMLLSGEDLFELIGIHCHFVGFDDEGEPQFWLDSQKGSGAFAEGHVQLNSQGIIVSGIDFIYDHIASLKDGKQEKRLRFGIFPQADNDQILVGGLRVSGKYRKFIAGSLDEVEILGDNRGFELGDLSEFTITRGRNSSFCGYGYTCTNNASYVYEGLYGLQHNQTAPNNSDVTDDNIYSWIKTTTDKKTITGETNCHFSVRVKTVTYSTKSGNTYTRTFYSKALFYDAADNVVAEYTLSTTAPGTSWREDSGSFLAPANATKAAIEVYTYFRVNSNAGGAATWNTAFDNFSIVAEQESAGDASWDEVNNEAWLYLDQYPCYYFNTEKSLLVSANGNILSPGTAITATVSGTAGNVDVGAHRYKVTFVDEMGETAASPVSNIATVSGSAKIVNLSNIPTGPWGTKTRRIYRTKADETEPYYFVGEVMNNVTTTFVDDLADEELEEYLIENNSTGSKPLMPARAFLPWLHPKGDTSKVTISTSQRLTFFGEPNTITNGFVSFESVYLAKGTYTLFVCGVKATNCGKLDWYLDNVSIATGQDWYASATTYNVVLTIANVQVMTNGLHILKFVVNGKHASSSSYRWTISYIEFIADGE